jgi:hypothetical protein
VVIDEYGFQVHTDSKVGYKLNRPATVSCVVGLSEEEADEDFVRSVLGSGSAHFETYKDGVLVFKVDHFS